MLLLAGPMGVVLRKLKQVYDLPDGLAVLKTDRLDREGRKWPKTCVFDLPTFFSVFQSAEFVDKLEKCGENLCIEWSTKNAEKNPGDRDVVAKDFVLNEHKFITSQGKREFSLLEMTLSTFGFTKRMQNVDECWISLDDVRVSIKTRSTKDVWRRGKENAQPSKDDEVEATTHIGRKMHFGGNAYNVPLPHFLRTLRDKKVQTIVNEAAKRKAKLLEEKNQLTADETDTLLQGMLSTREEKSDGPQLRRKRPAVGQPDLPAKKKLSFDDAIAEPELQ